MYNEKQHINHHQPVKPRVDQVLQGGATVSTPSDSTISSQNCHTIVKMRPKLTFTIFTFLVIQPLPSHGKSLHLAFREPKRQSFPSCGGWKAPQIVVESVTRKMNVNFIVPFPSIPWGSQWVNEITWEIVHATKLKPTKGFWSNKLCQQLPTYANAVAPLGFRYN